MTSDTLPSDTSPSGSTKPPSDLPSSRPHHKSSRLTSARLTEAMNASDAAAKAQTIFWQPDDHLHGSWRPAAKLLHQIESGDTTHGLKDAHVTAIMSGLENEDLSRKIDAFFESRKGRTPGEEYTLPWKARLVPGEGYTLQWDDQNKVDCDFVSAIDTAVEGILRGAERVSAAICTEPRVAIADNISGWSPRPSSHGPGG